MLLSFGGSLTNAQTVMKQQSITRMGIPPGNYSGITHVGDDLYAVVSDKEDSYAFLYLHIRFDLDTGKITGCDLTNPKHGEDNASRRDPEGIAYNPQTDTFFISGEADQRIVEYNRDGLSTGRELNVPPVFAVSNIEPNRGFESLTYNATTHRLWTTTELPLKSDKQDGIIRLQSFTDDLQPAEQYTYLPDKPQTDKELLRYIYGISDILALNDGSLIIMEREAHIKRFYIGSYCTVRLYRVHPMASSPTPLAKQLLCEFTTRLDILHLNFANYEGMCLGPQLNDGRQTVLLINDSQNRMGNKLYRLHDYIKVIILPNT